MKITGSYKGKIISVFIVFSLIISIGFMTFIFFQQKSYDTERLKSIGVMTVADVAKAIDTYLISQNYSDIIPLFESTVERHADLSYAYLEDTNLNIIIGYQEGGIFVGDGKATNVEAIKALGVRDVVLNDFELHYDAVSAVYVDGNLFGHIRIGVSKKELWEHIKILIVKFLITLLIIIVISVIVANLVGVYTTRSLVSLANAVKRIGNGNFETKVELRTNDEFELLADTISNMCINILELQRKAITEARNSQELEIARNIQTSLLPNLKSFKNMGYDISAAMYPAESIGGDYYDFISDGDGMFVSIGDVTGHGLFSGLIMVMVQVAIFTAIKSMPNKTPAEILSVVNNVISQNLRERIKSDHHMTINLLHENNGHFEYAGAHEIILIYRNDSDSIEQHKTSGMWLGIIPNCLSKFEKGSSYFNLNSGDVCLLYTDGVIEIKNDKNEQYDLERLSQFLKNNSIYSSDEIKSNLMSELNKFKVQQLDDISFVVLKKD